MKKKGFYFIIAIIFIVGAAAALSIFAPSLKKSEELITKNTAPPKENATELKENTATPQKNTATPKVKQENNAYLSITYTTQDSSIETGRMMNFYTYDLTSGKLDNKAQIPYSSQYALGAVSLSNNKIYYSSRKINEKGEADHLYEFNLLDGKSILLETENRAYNDIIPINDKLLVTTVPVHAIGTGIFDLETKTFFYLYETSLNEDGYMDFPYTTRPTSLNYNFKYERFVNVYVTEKDLYDLAIRSGEKPLNFHISLVDVDLNIKNDYIFTLESWIESNVTAATQISPDSVLVMVSKTDIEDIEKDTTYEFYKINFSDQSCKKIDSPFPNMLFIDNFITIDNGKSYYISGYSSPDVSGLFYYDCSNNEVKPILLDNFKKNSHVVNFCLIKE